MSNRTIYMSIIAFAAAAAVNATPHANAETPGHATLSELIQEDLDVEQEAFTLGLTKRTAAKINARMAKLDNVFGPLVAFDDAPEAIIDAARHDLTDGLNARVLASAEFEVAKDAANIESPFNPHLPMPTGIVAFASEER